MPLCWMSLWFNRMSLWRILYSECHFNVIMLKVVSPSVTILNAIMLSVSALQIRLNASYRWRKALFLKPIVENVIIQTIIMLKTTSLGVIMLNAIMLNAIMLNVILMSNWILISLIIQMPIAIMKTFVTFSVHPGCHFNVIVLNVASSSVIMLNAVMSSVSALQIRLNASYRWRKGLESPANT